MHSLKTKITSIVSESDEEDMMEVQQKKNRMAEHSDDDMDKYDFIKGGEQLENMGFVDFDQD